MGDGTEYVVTVSNESTTIQVIDGSVIFIDQYTNSTITVAANQVLTLPSGVPTGFSTQDLQSKISAFDASSVNQWWVQTAATATPTITTPTPTTDSSNGNSNPLSSTMILAAIIVVIIFLVVAVVAVLHSKKSRRQPGVPHQKRNSKNASQPVMYQNPPTTAPTTEASAKQPKPIFCPNCGNQLLSTEGSCPFCNSDLSQFYPTAKK